MKNYPIIEPVAMAITEPVATNGQALASERAQLVADLEATLQKLAELTAWAEAVAA